MKKSMILPCAGVITDFFLQDRLSSIQRERYRLNILGGVGQPSWVFERENVQENMQASLPDSQSN